MNITCAVASFTTRKMFEVMNLSNAFVYVIKRRIAGQFCHCHVFRPHHYRDATGKGDLRELVDSVPRAAPRSWQTIVFEARAVDHEIDTRAFCEWIVRAYHGNWNFVSTSAVRQTDDRDFVHAPAQQKSAR
jgi:hypothetical protein